MKKTKNGTDGKVLPVVFLAAAVCLLPCMLLPARAQDEMKPCSVMLTPSEPAVDNGISDIYGYYNMDSDVSVDILVEADEESAGIQKIEYRITDGKEGFGEGMQPQILYEEAYPEEEEEPGEEIEEEEEEEEEGLKLWEGTVSVDTARWNGGNVMVYVSAADFEGNRTETSVQLDIDITRPVLKLSYDNNDAGGMDEAGRLYFNREMPNGAVRTATLVITEKSGHFSAKKAKDGIRVTATDANGNLVNAEGAVRISAWTGEKGRTPEEDTHTATISFLKDAAYELEITYTDEAGNKNDGVDTGRAAAPWNFVVDTTPPVLTVSYDNNAPFTRSCYQQRRTATVQIREANFDPEKVNVMIKNSSGSAPTPGKWTRKQDGDGKGPVYTATIAFETDGDYTVRMSCTDLAGNRASEIHFAAGTTDGEAFTIDGTDPVVTVNYDNNEAENELYFKEPRTVTVTVEEHNFDPDLVDLNLNFLADGEEKTMPAVTWRHEGDIHTAKIACLSDGAYELDIAARDLAGNRSDNADFGSSAAAKKFTIDRTMPDVQILGVDDGYSYRGAVEPEVHLYDRNFSDYEISLTRTRFDEIDADVTDLFFTERELSGQGADLSCRAIERARENDGIYTLRLRAADLAGNEREEEVSFSVNRFGSVYVYSDYLTSLIRDGGVYTQKVEKDLVITEYNADRLREGSLLIDITRDARPVTNVICNVSPDPGRRFRASGQGWHEYRYTIDKSNFVQDGIYKISLSSEDEAGNKPDNTEATGMDILFRVDATAPEITGNVINDRIRASGKDGDFEYTVFDTMGLRSVEVYVDGTPFGEKITDFTEDPNYYSAVITLEGAAAGANVRLVATDLANNITDADYDIPAGQPPIRELLTSPGTALEQLEELSRDRILLPCVVGAAVAAAVFFILLMVLKKGKEK